MLFVWTLLGVLQFIRVAQVLRLQTCRGRWLALRQNGFAAFADVVSESFEDAFAHTGLLLLTPVEPEPLSCLGCVFSET